MAHDEDEGTIAVAELQGRGEAPHAAFRAGAMMDAFPEEGDRDVMWNALVVFAGELVKTGKLETKVGNGTDETVDKLLRIRGEVSESGQVKVAGLLKVLMPKRDIPEFLSKLVLDRQLGLGL